MAIREKFHNWELRSCARHGHVTFKPVGEDAEVYTRRLRAQTELGEAWRCLRCGTFVLGEPKSTGIPTHAPIILRGKALRQAVILRLLAAERLIRGLILLAAAYGVYRFYQGQSTLQHLFAKDWPIVSSAASQLHYDLDSSALVDWIRKGLALDKHTLLLAVAAIAIYGLIEAVEAVGLWLMKRWGEYFAVIATSMFIPLEVMELVKHVTLTKAGALVVNLVAVAYLLISKRLFGIRGGKAAYERELESQSLLEVQLAAADTKPPAVSATTHR